MSSVSGVSPQITFGASAAVLRLGLERSTSLENVAQTAAEIADRFVKSEGLNRAVPQGGGLHLYSFTDAALEEIRQLWGQVNKRLITPAEAAHFAKKVDMFPEALHPELEQLAQTLYAERTSWHAELAGKIQAEYEQIKERFGIFLEGRPDFPDSDALGVLKDLQKGPTMPRTTLFDSRTGDLDIRLVTAEDVAYVKARRAAGVPDAKILYELAEKMRKGE